MDRLDLIAIEQTLRELHGEKSKNSKLNTVRDQLNEDLLSNLLDGYQLVDELVSLQTDLFAPGNSQHVLELNNTILFGKHRKDRSVLYGKQLRLSERRFYDQQNGGIGGLIEFSERQNQSNVYRFAASVYIYLMARPQLFIEGNHRTGTLLMSYILLRASQPPVVLSSVNEAHYVLLSEQIKKCFKFGFCMWMGYPRLRHSCATWIKESADKRYLRY